MVPGPAVFHRGNVSWKPCTPNCMAACTSCYASRVYVWSAWHPEARVLHCTPGGNCTQHTACARAPLRYALQERCLCYQAYVAAAPVLHVAVCICLTQLDSIQRTLYLAALCSAGLTCIASQSVLRIRKVLNLPSPADLLLLGPKSIQRLPDCLGWQHRFQASSGAVHCCLVQCCFLFMHRGRLLEQLFWCCLLDSLCTLWCSSSRADS